MRKLQITNEVTLLGFRGGVLDLEVEIAQPPKAIEEESELVDEILQTNGMTSTGRLFKISVLIVNTAAVTRAGKKRIQLNEQKKAEMEKKLFKQEIGITMEAVETFHRCHKAGKWGTTPETAKDAKSIFYFCLAHEFQQMIMFPITTQVQRQSSNSVNFRWIQTAKHHGRLRWRNTSKMMTKSKRVKFKIKC